MKDRTMIRRALLDVRRALVLLLTFARTMGPPLLLRLGGKRESAREIGARVRKAFEHLGITYVKLGQFLAMRFDILPEEVCRELAKLFDAVPPMKSKIVIETIERELGKPIGKIFARFNREPLAAASIAQVHRGVLPTGEAVAIKVQRPRITEIFAADIRNLQRIARVGDFFRLLGPQSMVDAVEEFERFTSREMDFLIEASTAEKLRENAGPFEDVPRIYRQYSTPRILTMEFIDAPSLSEIIHDIESGGQALVPAGDRRERLSSTIDVQAAIQNLANASLRQLFVTGFFHADPHPGNILIREDGTVVFVDFGIFGQLSRERRETFAMYIENLAMGNIEQSYRHFVRLLEPTSETDPQQLKRDVYAIMRGWYEASRTSASSLAERHLGKYFSEFIEAIRANKVRMGLDTLLFWRALLALDATALRFKARFDLLGQLRTFFERIRPTPIERLIDVMTSTQLAFDLLQLAHDAPGDVSQSIDDVIVERPLVAVRSESAPQQTIRVNNDAVLIALPLGAASLFVIGLFAPLNVIGEVIVWTALLFTASAALIRRATT
jgi:ubiquinone biosynthesis protein